ncbi:MAG: hypothetical protein AAGA54_37145 [Myxococcota bacterium]
MRTFVQRSFGDAAWREVLSSMSPEDASALGGLVPVGWYPLALQHRLLKAIDAALGEGDGNLVARIGCYEAQQDLTVVHRLFLKMANPGFVLQQAGRYWGRFYDSGTWDIDRVSSTQANGVLRGLDPFDPSMADYLRAYIGEMWALMGATSVDVKTVVRGGDIHLSGRWA